MRYLTLTLLFTFIVIANEIDVKEIETKLKKSNLKSLHSKQLSKEEISYQEYKRILEIENKKLEDDGFCSCNND